MHFILSQEVLTKTVASTTGIRQAFLQLTWFQLEAVESVPRIAFSHSVCQLSDCWKLNVMKDGGEIATIRDGLQSPLGIGAATVQLPLDALSPPACLYFRDHGVFDPLLDCCQRGFKRISEHKVAWIDAWMCYTLRRLVIRKVLSTRIWGVPPAGGPLL